MGPATWRHPAAELLAKYQTIQSCPSRNCPSAQICTVTITKVETASLACHGFQAMTTVLGVEVE
ncbi:Hypothetical predicted protein [Prunus dulcis]|uniref:Uncharacterized protein n=1 Tax=Prunus dulcis TaxID=3755 RepID=A0A5E4GKY9_PRUDU|nr:Hypothetical predicted protein [Prunus dulcis]